MTTSVHKQHHVVWVHIWVHVVPCSALINPHLSPTIFINREDDGKQRGQTERPASRFTYSLYYKTREEGTREERRR